MAACHEIYRCVEFIVCIEYFSAQPQEIVYRGVSEVLFKRDYGGFWVDQFPDLRLIDYGFLWQRATGLDNLTWWLFEKAT